MTSPPPPLRIESSDIAVRRVARERWLGRIALVGLWLAGVGAVALAPGVSFCISPFVLLLVTAMLIGRSHGAPIAGVRRLGAPGVVTIDGGLVVETRGRRVSFTREEIASGWTERFSAGSDDVVLQMRDGAVVRWRAGSGDDARAALRAAGVAPEVRAVTLRLGVAEPTPERVFMVFLSLLVAFCSLTAIAFGVLMALTAMGNAPATAVMMIGLPLVLSYVASLVLLRPLVTSTLRIGTDGIAVERLLRRRFIPRASFREVGVSGKSLEISASDGAGVTLHVSSAEEAVTVAQRIRDAMAEQGDGAATAVLARLGRDGRTIASWIEGVRALARGASGYRDAKLERDELSAVVEDGAATAERRIAAAAALSGDEEGRSRVRIAAQACADERLRLAIEAAAEEEVDAARIEEALRARHAGRV
jgi:hypothetical protein